MTPINFTCRQAVPLAPDAICGVILDVSKWPLFTGYGPLPGIRSAQFEIRTPDVVGSRIRVVNTDGSSHLEEIIEWQPRERVVLRLHGFSAPLAWLAREFVETWEFAVTDGMTDVTRSFALHPTTTWARPALWGVAWLLKRAIDRSLRQLSDAA